jgi:DNA-binding transcriptional ArsR family regulator
MARPHNTPDVFRAVGHPARRRILDMLLRGPRTAAELGQPLKLTRPTISEHLRALRIAGLIEYRPHGAAHVYFLVRSKLRPIEDWMRPYQRKS